jgi:hypothetical protein
MRDPSLIDHCDEKMLDFLSKPDGLLERVGVHRPSLSNLQMKFYSDIESRGPTAG